MFSTVSQAKHSYDIVSKFQLEVDQISSVTADYLLFHEEHTIVQWNALYERLGALIQTLSKETEYHVWNTQINKTYGVLKTVFDRLVRIQTVSEYKTELASQLFVHIHELQYDAHNLGHAFSSTIKQVSRTIYVVLSAIVIIFFIFIFNTFLFVRVRILRPLEEQRVAVLNSFQGSYSYDHTPLHNDELGDLSNAFKTIIDEKNRAEKIAQLSTRLEAKNAELEQVIYVASHDLRSPLVNIGGYSQELEQSFADLLQYLKEISEDANGFEKIQALVDDDIAESIRFISVSAAKMDKLLLGLLKLSRLGRAAIVMSSIEMNPMMDSIVTSLDFQIKEAGTQVHVSSLPPCFGDPTQVEQVFTNLLDNAIKYLEPKRSGVISVTGVTEGRYSIYCVEDNGIGIEEKYFRKIFDIFHRISPSLETGEGIGLSIVERIVNRMGGKVWVESAAEYGCCFYVKIPTHNLEEV